MILYKNPNSKGLNRFKGDVPKMVRSKKFVSKDRFHKDCGLSEFYEDIFDSQAFPLKVGLDDKSSLLLEKLLGIFEKGTEAMSDASSELSEGGLPGICSQIARAFLGEAYDMMATAFSNNLGFITKVSVRIAIVLMLIYVMCTARIGKKYKALIFGSVSAAMFLMGDNEFKEIVDKLIFKSEYVAQSTEDELNEAVSVIGPLVHLVMVTVLTGKSRPTDNWSKFSIDAATNFQKTAEPFRNIIGLIKNVCRYTCDKFMIHVLGKKPFLLFSGLLPKALAWMDEANEIIKDDVLGNYVYNSDNLILLLNKQLDGMAICEDLFRSSDRSQIATIKLGINKLYAIQLKIEADGVVCSASRIEPVIMGFFGASGVGKSTLMKPLLCCILAKILKGERLARFLKDYNCAFFARYEEVKYWEGYRGQECTILDDFGQGLPSPGDTNDYMSVIRAGNSFEWHLHMATLAAKTNRYFNSRFFVLTSNIMDVEFAARNYIVCAEAAERRIDLNVEVTCKKEYCLEGTAGGKISSRRLDKTTVTDGFHPEIYEFHLRKRTYNNGVLGKMVTKSVLSFDQMVDEAIKIYHQKENMFECISRDTDKLVRQIVENRTDLQALDCMFNDDVIFDQAMESQGALVSRIPYGVDAAYRLFHYASDKLYMTDFRSDRDYAYCYNTFKHFTWSRAFIERAKGYSGCVGMINLDGNVRKNIDRLRQEFDRVIERDPTFLMAELLSFDELYVIAIANIGYDRDEKGYQRFERLTSLIFLKIFEKPVRFSDHTKELLRSVDYYKAWSKDHFDVLPTAFTAEAMFKSRRNLDNHLDMLFSFVYDIFSIACPGFLEMSMGDYEEKRDVMLLVALNAAVRDAASSFVTGDGRYYELNGYTHLLDDSVAKNSIALFHNKNEKYFGYVNLAMKVCGCFVLGATLGNAISSMYNHLLGGVERVDRKLGNLGVDVSNLHDDVLECAAEIDQSFGKLRVKDQAVFVAQGNDDALTPILEKVVSKNLYAVLAGDMLICFGFFVVDNTFVFPKHCFNRIHFLFHKNKSIITLCHPRTVEVKYTFEESDFNTFSQFEDKDITIGYLPRIRKHMDITNYLVDRQTFNLRKNGILVMPSFKEDLKRGCISRSDMYMPFRIRSEGFYVDSYGKKWTNMNSIEYSGITLNGDCGLPLFLVDPTARSARLLGFHVAGASNTNVGMGAFLWRSFFKDRPTVFKAQSGNYLTFKLVKILDRGPGSNSNSRIVKSKLFEDWGPSFKKPAHLKSFQIDGVRINPWDKAFRKYDVPKPDFGIDVKPLVARCFEMVVNSNPECSDYRRVLTIEEAICGVDGDPGIPPVNRTTSLGYPDNLHIDIRFPGKTRYLLFDNKYNLDNPEFLKFRKRIEDIQETLKNHRYDEFYYTGMLKDETLPNAKVDIGKTRYVSGASFAYTVLFNMYFGGFKAMMYHNRLHCYSAIGINPYSSDWHVMVTKMLAIGTAIFAGDHKWFDVLQIPAFHLALVEFLIQYLKCEDDPEHCDDIRRNLWKEVYNSRHIILNEVFEWYGSLPSGNPGTAYLNTLYNMFLLLFVWFKVIVEKQVLGLGMDDFEKHVCAYCFGDDVWSSISDLIRDHYNQVTIQECFRGYGMDFTNESKSENILPYRNISEVTFLKRGVRFEPFLGRYVAPLELHVILEFPYWTHKGASRNEIPITNVKLAIRELSLHGDEIFSTWAPILRDSLNDHYGHYISLLDREFYVNETCSMSPRDRGRPFALSEVDLIEL